MLATLCRVFFELDTALLDTAQARSLALRDAAADDAFVASLLAMVAANPPRCEPSGDKA